MNFSLKGYRTVILNAIVLIGALLELVGVIDGLTGGAFTLSGWGAGLIAFLSGANLVLRYLSDSPVFNSESKEASAIKTSLANAWASGKSLIDSVQAILEAKTPAETIALAETTK
jgi:hypothetical protein